MTPRQKMLLKAIVHEFMNTAEAVGSLHLPMKYNIKASPATVRNEMARLVKDGYLKQPHSSSGRIPTTYGLKYYLQELIEELDELEYQNQAEMRENLHQSRFNKNELISHALLKLSELTKNTAIAIIENHIYYSGLSKMLDMPEFREMQNLKALLKIMEDYSILYNLFENYSGDRNIKVLIGEETKIDSFDQYAVVFTEIKLYGDIEGYLGIIGPNRMNYARVIPALRSVANVIEEVVKGW